MKYLLPIVGIGLLFYSSRNIWPYMGDYSILTEYGKGYVIGQVLMFLLALAMVVLGWIKIRRGKR